MTGVQTCALPICTPSQICVQCIQFPNSRVLLPDLPGAVTSSGSTQQHMLPLYHFLDFLYIQCHILHVLTPLNPSGSARFMMLPAPNATMVCTSSIMIHITIIIHYYQVFRISTIIRSRYYSVPFRRTSWPITVWITFRLFSFSQNLAQNVWRRLWQVK